MVLHLVSWNVAGWESTLRLIARDYGPSSLTTKRKNVNGNAAALYFDRHGLADIVCIQEAKIQRRRLESGEGVKLGARLDGWESFWAACTDSSALGFNGVTTWARKGLVESANASPLEAPHLDKLGRCVRTDLAKIVIFNVYAPASCNPGGVRLQMDFFGALKKAALRAKAKTGKHVIICGDLNANYDARDLHWSRRRVRIDRVLKEAQRQGEDDAGENSEWKADIAKHWPDIEAALKNQRVVPQTTRNPNTGKEYEKFRLEVPDPAASGKWCKLGIPESSEADAACMVLESWHDEKLGELYPARSPSVEKLTEFMRVIARVHWDESVQKRIARQVGECPRSTPTVDWMRSMIEKDETFVDTYRKLYPNAEHNFTCWNQYKNCRYRNEGSRIDYFLVDNELFEKGAVLRCEPENECAFDGAEMYDRCDEIKGICRATANGGFQPARGDGGGLDEPTTKAMLTQFASIRHTGISYTPPKYSDHVAVTLLIDDEALGATPFRSCELASDSATKHAQPHKAQRTIMSMFAPRKKKASAPRLVQTQPLAASNVGNGVADQPTIGVKRPHPVSERPGKRHVKKSVMNGIKRFFGAAASSTTSVDI